MPKNFKFNGSRRYDPTATAAEVAMTDDNEYWGGDTRIFIQDPYASEPEWIDLGCYRNLTGGEMFHEMAETTCYGDRHKKYMPRHLDSEPLVVSISPKSRNQLDIITTSFFSKSYIQLAVLFSDSRYMVGPVRIERVGVGSPIDDVLSYEITFRRVGMPSTGMGWYSVVFDLQGGRWKNNEPNMRPFYTTKDEVEVPSIPEYPVISPYPGRELTGWVARNRISGTVVEPHQKQDTTLLFWTIEDDSLIISPIFGTKKINVFVIPDIESSSMGDIQPSTSIPAGSRYTVRKLSENDRPKSDTRRLTGWKVLIKNTGEEIAVFDADEDHSFVVNEEVAVVGVWKPLYRVNYNVPNYPDLDDSLPQDRLVVSGYKIKLPGMNFKMIPAPVKHTGWKINERTDYEVDAEYEVTGPVTASAILHRAYRAVFNVDSEVRASITGLIPIDTNIYYSDLKDKNRIVMPNPIELKYPGYTFKCWQRSGSTYKAGDIYTVNGSESSENPLAPVEIVFTAVWEESKLSDEDNGVTDEWEAESKLSDEDDE